MNFLPIFTKRSNCKLWSACYPEDCKNEVDNDIFTVLFTEKWIDTEYIRNFLKTNIEDLNNPFWRGLDLDAASQKIEIERDGFYELFNNINKRKNGFENVSLKDIFKELHKNIHSISTKEDYFRKAKYDMFDSIIRLYAIELEDETFVITGGAFKLSRTMERPHLKHELKKLREVQSYLKTEGIIDESGLI